MKKPPKKLEKLKNALIELDSLKNTIIKVIEQGGDVEIEWNNTGIHEVHSGGSFREFASNGAQTVTFIIPPHDISNK